MAWEKSIFMASNKKRIGLDQSTRNHLSALDAYIKEQAVIMRPMQPDEFTVYDYMSKMKNEGVKIEFTKAVRTINNLLDTEAITTRKGIKNGKQCNFFRFL